jgi:hypothetical protein
MSVLWLDEMNHLGVRSTLLSDADWGPNAVIRREQDCRAILEQNRREANAFQPEMQRNAIGARKIASIPLVLMDWFKRWGIVDKRGRVVDERAFLRALSDPELRYLRTDNGRRLA